MDSKPSKILLIFTVLYQTSALDVFNYQVLPPVYNVGQRPPLFIRPLYKDTVDIGSIEDLFIPNKEKKFFESDYIENSIHFPPILPLEPHNTNKPVVLTTQTEASKIPGFHRKTTRRYSRPPKARPTERITYKPKYIRPRTTVKYPVLKDIIYNQPTYNKETQKEYFFDYKVKDYPSGNNFGHQESSDGNVVKGEYHVKRPDGKLQKVAYSVEGDTGLKLDFIDT